MMTTRLTPALVYLLDYLKDEFRNYPEVRIQVVQPSGTRKSPDLLQNYDASANDLHTRSGVVVRTGSREHWFPVQWAEESRFEMINALARQVREQLGDAF
jgi:hypothetical protein